MSNVEASVALLLETFYTYAGADGNKDTLNKTEVKALFMNELPGLIKSAKNQARVEELLKELDFDGDSEVDFSEFMMLIAVLTCACHDRYYRRK